MPLTSDSADRLVGVSPANFVSQLIDRPSDWNATDAFEVARFRLIAVGLSRTGNDEMYLGNHDANLLFLKRNDFDFDEQENRTLIDAGIAGFHHQNVPLWNWVSAPVNSNDIFWHIKIRTTYGSEQEKSNAFRLLQCTRQKTPNIDEILDRKRFLRAWLLENPSDKAFNAALDFLNTNGDSDDLSIIEEFFFDQIPENRKIALTATIAVLLAAADLSKAFERFIELDPDTAGDIVASALFAYPESIPTATAERCLRLKSDSVRRATAVLLNSRQAIDTATAEKLLTDTDPEVRLVAVESLTRHGVPLLEDTIKKALVRHQPAGLLGFGYNTSVADDSFYERYRRNQLLKLSYEELRKKVDTSSMFDQLEIATLFERHTRRCLAQIRANLADGFKSYFDSKFDRLASLYRSDEELLSNVRKLEDGVRRGLVSKTLNALCAYSNAADLELTRKTLDNWEVDFSPISLLFLGRFGDWSDVNRILAFSKRSQVRLSLLSMPSDENTKAVASALYVVGKSRLIDLLGLEVSFSVRRALLREFSQKDIVGLSDETLISQLNSGDDEFRKTLAAKCALSLSQARSRKLLEKYIAQEGQRYYSSIHWLDLGATMSRDLVKAVTKFELRTST